MEILSKKTKVLGHRGNSSTQVENSMSSLLYCSINLQIDGAECDVRITKDGKIVLMHNARIDGISKGKGLIQDFNYNELQKYLFHTSFTDYTLRQLFALKNYDIQALIEYHNF